jgi:lipopolysaccharide transport system ATP-binding protein
MSDYAIRASNLTKAYHLGTADEKQDTLVGAALSIVTSPFRNFRNLRKLSDAAKSGAVETDAAERTVSSDCSVFWALKGVSLDVKKGEVVGIIGRNGAGKSTLLKILSRITEPTSGTAELHGRLGSLLEVGTGFHPDLSGRENVFLNGSILGMRKQEIESRFNEIVEFSGVRRFIDTPVKRYSSGMKVRLAFSVAAHFEPEILIIDEVLAVGDAEFQKKCIDKIQNVTREGRTVLFVSHSMASMARLCSRGILLENGAVRMDAAIDDVIKTYLSQQAPAARLFSFSPGEHRCQSGFQIAGLEFDLPEDRSVFFFGDPVAVNFRIRCTETIRDARIGLGISQMGHRIFTVHSEPLHFDASDEEYMVRCVIPARTLLPGNFSLTVGAFSAGTMATIDFVTTDMPLEISDLPSDAGVDRDVKNVGAVEVRADWSKPRPRMA